MNFMAYYEILVVLAIFMTALVVYKMAWSHNIQSNLIGELVIISLGFVLEDGPEMILQYFYVDKYSGTNYEYPDGFKTSGRLTVFASSLVSFLIALFNIFNLLSLYLEFRVYLRFRSFRFWLDLPDAKIKIENLIQMFLELKQIAKEEQMKEKLDHDLNAIEKKIEQHDKNSKTIRRSNFRERLKTAEKNYVENIKKEGEKARKTNKRELSKIIYSDHDRFKNVIIVVFVAVGLMPFIANLMRLASSTYQIFKYR